MVPVVRRDMFGRPVRDVAGRPIIHLVTGYSWIQITGVTKTVTVAKGDPTKGTGGGDWQAGPSSADPNDEAEHERVRV